MTASYREIAKRYKISANDIDFGLIDDIFDIFGIDQFKPENQELHDDLYEYIWKFLKERQCQENQEN